MNMKKILMAALLLGSVCGKASATAVGDTIVIEDAKKVRIETRDTVQRIVINGSKEDPQLHYVQRIAIADSSAVRRTLKSVKDFNKITIKGKDGKPSKWESSFHINIGLNAMLDVPSECDFKLWPSFDIGLSWLADWRPYGKQNVWSVGLGLDWRYYYTADKQYWQKTGDLLNKTPFVSPMKETSSSLSVSTLQIPILYTHYFDKRQKWGITVGGTLNWNFSASANREYEIGDEDYDINTKKIGQRPFTIDAVAMLHIPSFPSIYCKYCPMEFFKDGRGPKAKQLTVGFCF